MTFQIGVISPFIFVLSLNIEQIFYSLASPDDNKLVKIMCSVRHKKMILIEFHVMADIQARLIGAEMVDSTVIYF